MKNRELYFKFFATLGLTLNIKIPDSKISYNLRKKFLVIIISGFMSIIILLMLFIHTLISVSTDINLESVLNKSIVEDIVNYIKNIQKSIGNINDVMVTVLNKYYSKKVTVEAKGEFNKLKENINKSIFNSNEIISELVHIKLKINMEANDLSLLAESSRTNYSNMQLIY